MSTETEHKVKIDILGDASNLEKELKEAASDIKKFQKNAERVRRVDASSAKELDKLTKKYSSDKMGLQKKSLSLENQISQSIRRTVRDMRGKASSSRSDLHFDKIKVKQLEQQTTALANLGKQRRKIEQADARAQRGGGKRGGGGFGLGAIGRGIGRYAGGAALAVGGAAVYGAARTTTQDLSSRAQYELKRGSAQGFSGMSEAQSDTLKSAGKKAMFSPDEVLQQSAQLLTTTGSAKMVTAVLPEMMKLARTKNVDIGAFQGLGAAAVRGSGELTVKQMREAVAAGTVAGMKKGRLTEFIQATTELQQQQMQISTGDVTGAGVNALMAQLGSTGNAGLQGMRGAGVANKMNSAIRNPQGEAMKMLMLQAVGMGDDKSYVEALEVLQQGIFDDDTGMDTMRQTVQRAVQIGGGDENSEVTAMMAEGFNLTIRQFRDVRKALASDGTEKEIRDEVDKITKEKLPNNPLVEQLKLSTAASHEDTERTKALAKATRDLEKEILELKKVMMEMLVPVLRDKVFPALQTLAEATTDLLRYFKDSDKTEKEDAETVDEIGDKFSTGGKPTKEEVETLRKITKTTAGASGTASNASIFSMAGMFNSNSGMLPAGLQQQHADMTNAAFDNKSTGAINAAALLEDIEKDKTAKEAATLAMADAKAAQSGAPVVLPTVVIIANTEEAAEANAQASRKNDGIPSTPQTGFPGEVGL